MGLRNIGIPVRLSRRKTKSTEGATRCRVLTSGIVMQNAPWRVVPVGLIVDDLIGRCARFKPNSLAKSSLAGPDRRAGGFAGAPRASEIVAEQIDHQPVTPGDELDQRIVIIVADRRRASGSSVLMAFIGLVENGQRIGAKAEPWPVFGDKGAEIGVKVSLLKATS